MLAEIPASPVLGKLIVRHLVHQNMHHHFYYTGNGRLDTFLA
ncbi:hypothetical protein GCM10025794_20730 [Massilia kyonggiensis]